MDLVGEAGTLGLLCLHDPHRQIAIRIGRVVRCDERGIPAFQEQPGPGQGSLGELQPGQAKAVTLELRREGVDLPAQCPQAGVTRTGLR